MYPPKPPPKPLHPSQTPLMLKYYDARTLLHHIYKYKSLTHSKIKVVDICVDTSAEEVYIVYQNYNGGINKTPDLKFSRPLSVFREEYELHETCLT